MRTFFLGLALLLATAFLATTTGASAASLSAASAVAQTHVDDDTVVKAQGYGGGYDDGYRRRRYDDDGYRERRYESRGRREFCWSCARRCDDGWCPPRCWGWRRYCHRRY